MHQLLDLYKNSENLHHAYLFVTHEVEETILKLKHFVEEHLGMQTHGNPDVSHLEFKTLTIDEARAIAESENRKNIGGGRKIFIIKADFITEEAQNSLLKVFEEPTAGTHFFLVSPQDIFLPTLRSRMHIIRSETSQRCNLGERMPKGVLDMGVKERMDMVKEITEDISDEKKTKQDAIAFLNQIERELYEKGTAQTAGLLAICEDARRALYDRGAPVKMILENVVLSV